MDFLRPHEDEIYDYIEPFYQAFPGLGLFFGKDGVITDNDPHGSSLKRRGYFAPVLAKLTTSQNAFCVSPNCK